MRTSSLIHRLAPHVVQHIAAGEVIEHPSGLIKELIENALDAQATRIEIEMRRNSYQHIKIIDNGNGIPRRSLPLVFERYATSKIHQIDDLQQSPLYGFRGEALAALSGVADITIISRALSEPEGYMIRTVRGVVEGIYPIGCRVGTSVIVDKLFERFPVRRSQLDDKKHHKLIRDVVVNYGLLHPKVGFLLHQPKQHGIMVFEHDSVYDRIRQLWQLNQQQLFSIQVSTGYCQAEGWFSLPAHFTPSPKNQQIMINNRPAMAKSIKEHVLKGFTHYRHAGLHPQYFLSLHVPGIEIDVNIHPQKNDVKLLREHEIGQLIEHTIQQKLESLPIHALRFTSKQTPGEQSGSLNTPKELVLTGELVQVDRTYIVAESSEGMILIDQHAADERLWYNRLLEESALLQQVEADLSSECQQELDDDLYQHSFEETVHARIATIACHQAIRAGEVLSSGQMERLAQEILAGGNSTLVCPHGRPTYLVFSREKLAEMFRRA